MALIPRTNHHYEDDDSEYDESDDLPDIVFDQTRFVASISVWPPRRHEFSGLNIEQLLSSFNNLEIYCDAPEASFYESTPSCSVDISLEEALHFPQRISPRIPTETNSKRQLTLGNLKAMWCRDVAHYFEWVAGVPELRLMDVHEKVKLVTRQLCKIICLMLSYWTYGQAHDGIIFGSGIYFTPSERQDETLSSFLGSLANVVQNSITSIFRKIAITREEYLLMKLINLFDTPNVHFPPPDRIVVDAALKKYQAALVNHIKLTHPSLDYNAVTERVSALFGVMPYLEVRSLLRCSVSGKVMLIS
ncbi:Ligand-binding domain of nuclear hormone receptor [Ostertagia ostertagi]